MNFPFILYPKSIEQLIKSEYRYEASELMFDRFYETCKKEHSKKIITKPIKPSLDTNFFAELEYIGILDILLLIFLWWIVLPFILVKFIIELFRYAKNYIAYAKVYKKYKFLIQLTEEYSDQSDFYFSVRRKFLLLSINDDIDLTKTITEVKRAKLKEITKDIVKPINHDQVINLQKGISENFFVNQLKAYFDFTEIGILTDCSVDCFFPDVVLYTEDGLYVDIEIDEPYVGNTKEVIHYYEPESNFYYDGARNNFFLDSGWLIIRFTEKQIIKNSMSCCYEIALVLSKIFDLKIPEDKVKERLVPERFWSKELGEKLANSNYRNSYFPEKLNQRFSI